MRVSHLIFVALTAAGCLSDPDPGPCPGVHSCPNIGTGMTLPGSLNGAKSITTEPPCQVTLTHEVPAVFSASLPAGTTMATCPLHVHFASGPDLDSTITITYITDSCCGGGWSFWSPIFFDQTSQPDASRAEASDAAEVNETGDASQAPDATDATRTGDVSLDGEAIDAADVTDASIE
jgi:hypothetical protein